jgi:two-component system sensor histidine kinase/response regulator
VSAPALMEGLGNNLLDVLIVDDEPRNLQLLGNLLRGQGYRTAFATGGQQALECARRTPPQLILLDINLPGLDGLCVCRALKEDTRPEVRSIPIIFLTARIQPEDIVEGFRAGGVDYVTKPFHSDELLARVKTHLELRRVREDLARINENQRRFVTLLAHDLRNPIGGLKDMPKLLLDEDAPPTVEFTQEIATIMRDETQRVFDLLEEVLLLSQLQMGRATPRQENFGVKMMLAHVLKQLEGFAREKGVKLHLTCSDDLTADADPVMIATVVRNLAQNAVKFSSRGGNVFVEALHRYLPEGLDDEPLDVPTHDSGLAHGFVMIRVTDHGIGLRPEVAETLFDPLRSRSTPGTDQESGTGLGLPLCSQLLQLHHSRLQVDSKLGGGASFYFYLAAPAGAVV